MMGTKSLSNIDYSRANTSGRALVFVSGGPVKVEAAPAIGAVRVVGAPGPAGPQGATGQQGPAGAPGSTEITNASLDGGNF